MLLLCITNLAIYSTTVPHVRIQDFVVSKAMAGETAHREMGGGRLWLSLSVSSQLVTVATVRDNATVIKGKVGSISVEIMLDIGSVIFFAAPQRSHFNEHLPNLSKVFLNPTSYSVRRTTSYYQLC